MCVYTHVEGKEDIGNIISKPKVTIPPNTKVKTFGYFTETSSKPSKIM